MAFFLCAKAYAFDAARGWTGVYDAWRISDCSSRLKWSKLEQQILQTPDLFDQYPLQYKSRVTGINQLLKRAQVKRPEFNQDTLSQQHFEQQNKLVSELLLQLKQDRAIIKL